MSEGDGKEIKENLTQVKGILPRIDGITWGRSYSVSQVWTGYIGVAFYIG